MAERENYTNDDGQMVCQVCSEEMPFKLDDDSYYFEAVECVKDAGEHLQNHIALCPVCAAKYKSTNPLPPTREAILKATNLSVPVTLAREAHMIHFVQVHLQDLQAAVRATAEDLP